MATDSVRIVVYGDENEVLYDRVFFSNEGRVENFVQSLSERIGWEDGPFAPAKSGYPQLDALASLIKRVHSRDASNQDQERHP